MLLVHTNEKDCEWTRSLFLKEIYVIIVRILFNNTI